MNSSTRPAKTQRLAVEGRERGTLSIASGLRALVVAADLQSAGEMDRVVNRPPRPESTPSRRTRTSRSDRLRLASPGDQEHFSDWRGPGAANNGDKELDGAMVCVSPSPDERTCPMPST